MSPTTAISNILKIKGYLQSMDGSEYDLGTPVVGLSESVLDVIGGESINPWKVLDISVGLFYNCPSIMIFIHDYLNQEDDLTIDHLVYSIYCKMVQIDFDVDIGMPINALSDIPSSRYLQFEKSMQGEISNGAMEDEFLLHNYRKNMGVNHEIDAVEIAPMSMTELKIAIPNIEELLKPASIEPHPIIKACIDTINNSPYDSTQIAYPAGTMDSTCENNSCQLAILSIIDITKYMKMYELSGAIYTQLTMDYSNVSRYTIDNVIALVSELEIDTVVIIGNQICKKLNIKMNKPLKDLVGVRLNGGVYVSGGASKQIKETLSAAIRYVTTGEE